MSTTNNTAENNNTTADTVDPRYGNVVNTFFDFIDRAAMDPKIDKQELQYFKNAWLREMQKRPQLFAKIWSGNADLFREATEQYTARLTELKSEHNESMRKIAEYYNNDPKIMTSFIELEKRLAEKHRREIQRGDY